jgi:hypothetical protein
MCILDLAALAEQRIRFAEEQYGAGRLRLVEQAGEVLLGLADVLVDDAGQIDAIQVEGQFAGQDLGGHRLAGARLAAEQHRQPAAHRQAPISRMQAFPPLT